MTNSRAASAATPGEFRVRALGPDDVLASASLIHADGIGWQQTEEDLKQVLNGQDALGVFLGDSLVSMATLPAIAPDFGWLAYVATAPDARRRGYARLLVSQLLSARGNRQTPSLQPRLRGREQFGTHSRRCAQVRGGAPRHGAGERLSMNCIILMSRHLT